MDQSCAVYKSASGCGVIFKLSPTPNNGNFWTETVLYSFTGGTDGAVPSAELIFDSRGALYGTTAKGGSETGSCAPNGGCGVVFRVAPPVSGTAFWSETILYSFTGSTDGALPSAGLIFDSEGNVYGETANGGSMGGSCSSGGCGVVFRLAPPVSGAGSWTERVLYSFAGGLDGDFPGGGLMFDSKENLYGTTQYGGNATNATGNGVVFELSPSS
jgi:uncharacterized repeat protein (TIGR03803 family)